jgi:hypothetical protein
MTTYYFAVANSVEKIYSEQDHANNKEHDAVVKAAGISRVRIWIQHTALFLINLFCNSFKTRTNLFSQIASYLSAVGTFLVLH